MVNDKRGCEICTYNYGPRTREGALLEILCQHPKRHGPSGYKWPQQKTKSKWDDDDKTPVIGDDMLIEMLKERGHMS